MNVKLLYVFFRCCLCAILLTLNIGFALELKKNNPCQFIFLCFNDILFLMLTYILENDIAKIIRHHIKIQTYLY